MSFVTHTVVLKLEVKGAPSCSHWKVTFEFPVGKNLQASLVADHVPVFLPGGNTALVPVAFWIPITPLPEFHVVQDVLSLI